jgi:hypothetical protein
MWDLLGVTGLTLSYEDMRVAIQWGEVRTYVVLP